MIMSYFYKYDINLSSEVRNTRLRIAFEEHRISLQTMFCVSRDMLGHFGLLFLRAPYNYIYDLLTCIIFIAFMAITRSNNSVGLIFQCRFHVAQSALCFSHTAKKYLVTDNLTGEITSMKTPCC